MNVRILALAILLAACATAAPPAVTRVPTPALERGGRQPLFSFHSAFWVNLHHVLYVQARARAGRDQGRETVAAALRDTAGLGARSEAERRAWEAAVAYYVRELAPRDVVFDSGLVALKARLFALESAASLRGAPGIDAGLAEVLESVAPLYRALWWPRHDRANRAWVDAVVPLLDRYGDSIAAGVTRAMRLASWPTSPVRVDVSAHTNWSGAYTTERPSHIMMSSTAEGYAGTLGLEMLFHEALHTLEDSVAAARVRTRETEGVLVPYNVVHAIIFYTAGEVTRRTVPGHTPYIEAYGMVRRGSMSPYYPILARHWKPWLDGTTSFDDAWRAIVAEVRAIPPPR